ncbi:MAG: amidohydrolase [Anaerolineae bacterium]|nr:amidohydrolase [Anaerolineae bacterium]
METILFNGAIYTMDPHRPQATAVAIRDGWVRAVGGDELRDSPAAAEVVDLEGRCVVPGLADSHIHFVSFALGLQQIDLTAAPSLAEMVARVARRVRETPPGEWILGRGWDQELWPEGRFPTAADLDAAAPQHPVALLAKSGHALVVNSLALERAGIPADPPDPPGGRFERAAGGSLSGLVLEEAIGSIMDCVPQPDAETAAAALRSGFERAWRVGLTSIHDVDGGVAFDAYQRLHARGELGLRVIKYLPLEVLDAALELNLRAGLGDDWLRVGGIKLFADGALGPRTAAMLAPYVGEPDNLGILTIQEEELGDIAQRASTGGLPLAVHAIGDRANRMVLDALAAVQAAGLPALRHRIEHVQALHQDDVGRLAALGVVASMQPLHAPQDALMADRYWGERSALAYAWRSLLDAGTVLAFGSDCPVEDLAPLRGIHAAVTRARPDGYGGPQGWRPQQCLAVKEAVRAYTRGAAYAGGVERRLGMLAPGQRGDLVLLERDIFTGDPAAIAETAVLGTMIAGEWKWRG